MLFFTIDILKQIRAQFFFLYFKSRGVSFEICLITPHYLPIIFDLVKTVVFDLFRSIYIIYKSYIFSFPTILALQDARVHVHVLNCCNMTTDVKVSVNKTLGLGITLSILYVYSNYYYVRLWKSFNNV